MSKEGRNVLVHGYHGCMAVACQNGRRKTVPLALKLWSSNASVHKGENDAVLKAVASILVATGGRAIIVYDWGCDSPVFCGGFHRQTLVYCVKKFGLFYLRHRQ